LQTGKEEQLEITVTDVLGRRLIQQVQNVSAGDNTIKLPVGKLPVGTYLLNINGTYHSFISKFTKE